MNNYSYPKLIKSIQTIQNKVKKVHFTKEDWDIVDDAYKTIYCFLEDSLLACKEKLNNGNMENN